jgi:hypothetical protein
VNEEGALPSELTPELPPKITKYRHNEAWHTDKTAEDEAEEEENDEEEVNKMKMQRELLDAKRRKKEATPPAPPSGADDGEEKKEDTPTMRRAPGKVRTMSSDRATTPTTPASPDRSPEKAAAAAADGEHPAPVILNDAGEPGKPGDRTSVWQKKITWVVEHLKISKGRKKSAADLRREELRKKRAEEAAAAERARQVRRGEREPGGPGATDFTRRGRFGGRPPDRPRAAAAAAAATP